jgi:hypothetical protein
MTSADLSRADAQSAANILCSYLSEQGHALRLEIAVDICQALALATMVDIKSMARPLRDALSEHAIRLKQSHALEVLARVAGHSCYMRAKQASAEPLATHVILCAVDGEMHEPRASASIGEAVTSLLTTALGLIPSRTRPAFCKVSRHPSGLQLEVSQVDAPWFMVQLVKFREDSLASENLVLQPIGDDVLRVALRKVIANIEQARPTALVLNGAVPESLSPWYCAAFHLTALRSRTARIVSDERELFLMLDATGCDRFRAEHGSFYFEGRDESFRVEVAWVDMTGKDAEAKKADAASTLKSVFQRYLRYRQALPGNVSDALLAVGGAGNSTWHAPASYQRIEALATERAMTIAALASKAEVPFREVKRLQDFELAAPALIIKLALALNVAPGELLTQHENGLGFAADTGEQFLKMVSGAMAYRCLEGNSLRNADFDDARRLLETAKDIAEIAAFETGEHANSSNSFDEPPPRFERMAQELLEDANSCGIKLIFSREVEFVQTGKRTSSDAGFMAMNVLTICAERTDGATSAMWTSID